MDGFKLISLNINGLNCKKKQEIFFNFVKENYIKIVNLQEHNIKDSKNLFDKYYEHFHVIINESINLKGVAAVLIDKTAINSNILSIEKSFDARITSVKFTYNGKYMHVLNVYAPSGSNFLQERENMFKEDILYYLRNNLSNNIICGDFNCIENNEDKSLNGNCPLSKSLKYLTENLKLKDIWNFLSKKIQFTFFRENYGSRIDRIYAADFKENFTDIWVQPVSFSDHSVVFSTIEVDGNFVVGRAYWKLNVKLLELENIEEGFEDLWARIIKLKHKFENVNQWWELCGKVKIQKFFQNKGREQRMFKQGLIKYLEI